MTSSDERRETTDHTAGGRWFARSTFAGTIVGLEELEALKNERGTTISVCLPTLDESTTVGAICHTIRAELMDTTGLVDELVVLDSGSRDDTTVVARDAGATVHVMEEVLPQQHHPRARGKGEAVWKSLAVLKGELIVWLDADVASFDVQYVARLIRPMLEGSCDFVKAFYRRPLRQESGGTLVQDDFGGGRVTELAARPLINSLAPELSYFAQPLAGECAIRREVALGLPIATGYGVDVALLFDAVQRVGLERTAQADLGTRVHRNRDITQLGRMSFEVLHALLRRLQTAGRLDVQEGLSETLVQFLRETPAEWDLAGFDRPPMAGVLR